MNSDVNPIEKKAFREAGYIVMAYFSGYSCKNADLVEKNITKRIMSLDFSTDTPLINAISEYRDNPDFYEDLSDTDKKRSRDVAVKTIIVIMGGPAAESFQKNGLSVYGNPLLSMPAGDLDLADKIDYFLSIVKQGQHPGNFLQAIFRQVLKIIEEKEVWKAVSTLAEALIRSNESRLERKEIDKILIETGFLSHLCNLRKGSPKTEQTVPRQEGFSREELEKMKKKMSDKVFINKEEAISKIVGFTKTNGNGPFSIGIADDSQNELLSSAKIVVETPSHSVAKEVMMYFVCLGMTISPGSSKNQTASVVYVCQ